MNIKKTISLVCSMAVFSNLFFCFNLSISAEEDSIKILSIGDSITDGYGWFISQVLIQGTDWLWIFNKYDRTELVMGRCGIYG